MTADRPTDFPYEPAPEQKDPATLRKYWSIAKGLQAVDGLKPSEYLEALSQETIEGKRSLDESGEILRRYYANPQGREEDASTPSAQDGTAEADLVSQRITELLARGAFLFAPEMLSRIHAYLFQDLDTETYRPGQYKEQPLLKRESILNGDSVSYADPTLIEASLRVAFEDEIAHAYGAMFDEAALENLARFLSRIWQAHPFVEGNTRTVAVFAVLYLNDLGYDITNESFEHHARYFRDALVRANYRNPKANAFPDSTFLIRFLDSVLSATDEGYEEKFDSEELKVTALFDDPSLLRVMLPKDDGSSAE